MIFSKTELIGAYIIDIKRLGDDRGFFARTWCINEFEENGLNTRNAQSNIGFSPKKGTLRGLHFQAAPYEEAKVIRCTAGAIFDVIVDLRIDSPSYRKWMGIELTAKNHRMLYVPEGFAHGYLTLMDDTEMFYQSSQFYYSDRARGIRYNDPGLDIKWPIKIEVISSTDKNWPDYLF